MRPSRKRAASADWSLYFVTDTVMAGGVDAVPGQVAEAIEGGAHVIQVRDKALPDAEFAQLAHAVQATAQAVGEDLGRDITVVINDRVEVAAQLGLDVHVGQGDAPARKARERLGEEAIVGVSVSSAEELEAVIAEAVADVVGVGPVWDTPTKTDAAPAVGLDGLAKLTARAHEAGLIVVAIGGITIRNAGDVAGTGCDGVCVISAIASADDPALAATFVRREFLMNLPEATD